MFQRVGEAYAALCDPCIALVGKGASGISPPLSPGLAREVYRQTFGEYRKKNYSEGAVIGLPFSYELRDALERSKGTRENLSFGFWKYRVHFFRTWFIKLELSLTIQLCETMATWIAISLCK